MYTYVAEAFDHDTKEYDAFMLHAHQSVAERYAEDVQVANIEVVKVRMKGAIAGVADTHTFAIKTKRTAWPIGRPELIARGKDQ